MSRFKKSKINYFLGIFFEEKLDKGFLRKLILKFFTIIYQKYKNNLPLDIYIL